MTGNEYQVLAARTINHDLQTWQKELHALHGMVGEKGIWRQIRGDEGYRPGLHQGKSLNPVWSGQRG